MSIPVTVALLPLRLSMKICCRGVPSTEVKTPSTRSNGLRSWLQLLVVDLVRLLP